MEYQYHPPVVTYQYQAQQQQPIPYGYAGAPVSGTETSQQMPNYNPCPPPEVSQNVQPVVHATNSNPPGTEPTQSTRHR